MVATKRRGRPEGLKKCLRCEKFHLGRCQCETCATTQARIFLYERLLGGPLALCRRCAEEGWDPEHEGLPDDCPSCLKRATMTKSKWGNRHGDFKLKCTACGLEAYWSEP